MLIPWLSYYCPMKTRKLVNPICSMKFPHDYPITIPISRALNPWESPSNQAAAGWDHERFLSVWELELFSREKTAANSLWESSVPKRLLAQVRVFCQGKLRLFSSDYAQIIQRERDRKNYSIWVSCKATLLGVIMYPFWGRFPILVYFNRITPTVDLGGSLR